MTANRQPKTIPLRWLIAGGALLLAAAAWWLMPHAISNPTAGPNLGGPIVAYHTVKIGPGTDPSGADPQLDDSSWDDASLNRLPTGEGPYWLRIHAEFLGPDAPTFRGALQYFTGVRHRVLERIATMGSNSIAIESPSSHEIYVDGQPLGSTGVVGDSVETETPGNFRSFFALPRVIREGEHHVIAIRFSSHNLHAPGDTFKLYVFPGRFEDQVARPWFPATAALGVAAAALIAATLCAAAWWLIDRKRQFLTFAIFSGLLVGFALITVARTVGGLSGPAWLAAGVWGGVVAAAAGVMLLLSVAQFLVLPHAWIWSLPALFPTLALLWTHPLTWQWGAWGTRWTLACGLVLGLIGAGLRCTAWAWVVGSFGVALAAHASGWALMTFNLADPVTIVILIPMVAAMLRSIGTHLRSEQLVARQSQLQSARLETELLKRNIQPHFLINSLTSIAQLIEESPPTAVDMIDALADEFRLVSRVAQERLIPLATEIELCRAHLRVMSLRRETRFELRCDGVDEETLIPPAIFHTLVENAVSHGSAGDSPLRTIVLREERSWTGGRVFQMESPTGAAARGEAAKREGTGTRYVKARLEEAFPGRWSFDASQAGDHWISRIEIREEAA